MGRPFMRRSHITSLINPIASVVFASSKKAIVSTPYAIFLFASFSTTVTNSLTSASVVPP